MQSQGATIKTDERTGKIVIARVMHGGAADRSGLIHPGDEVIEVNGIDVLGKTPNDVLEILVSALFISSPPPPCAAKGCCHKTQQQEFICIISLVLYFSKTPRGQSRSS